MAVARFDGAEKTLPPQYLLNELRSRLGTGPVSWDLVLQFPHAGDPLDDATRRWPEGRPTIVAGTLTVERVEDDQRPLESLVFDPTGVVAGIELSDDPLLSFRAEVYGESYRRRTRETRALPAPSDMGQ
jgi:catalase